MSPIDTEVALITSSAEAAGTIRQQPGIFGSTRQSLLCRCRLCIEVSGRKFEHRPNALNWQEIQLFFSEYFISFD
jgi:hypothetical protein